MTEATLFVQVDLGVGNVIIELLSGSADQPKTLVWYPSPEVRPVGESLIGDITDTSYRDNGGVIVTFKSDEDIDRLIGNLQRLRAV